MALVVSIHASIAKIERVSQYRPLMGVEAAIINVVMERGYEGDLQASTELVERAVAGDRVAFDRLVEPYLSVALGAAKLITGQEADAADAVQDALFRSWQALGSLRDPLLFAAWFRKIVVRSATRLVSHRRPVVELDLEAPAPAESLDSEFDRRQLARAFARLDPKDRVLLTLHHYWRLPVAESAELLGIPEGTVRSRVHHALRRLRACYDAEVRG
jgi:RNA polymerase sigma-70 factor, ECF subfamily